MYLRLSSDLFRIQKRLVCNLFTNNSLSNLQTMFPCIIYLYKLYATFNVSSIYLQGVFNVSSIFKTFNHSSFRCWVELKNDFKFTEMTCLENNVNNRLKRYTSGPHTEILRFFLYNSIVYSSIFLLIWVIIIKLRFRYIV